MSSIEKIKQARHDLDAILEGIAEVLSPLGRERLLIAINRLSYLQAEALRQATEVADENFARAQKLSEQVQENVRHIERLAERRSNSDQQILEALGSVANRVDAFLDAERAMPLSTLQICQDKLTIALALAKGEAV